MLMFLHATMFLCRWLEALSQAVHPVPQVRLSTNVSINLTDSGNNVNAIIQLPIRQLLDNYNTTIRQLLDNYCKRLYFSFEAKAAALLEFKHFPNLNSIKPNILAPRNP